MGPRRKDHDRRTKPPAAATPSVGKSAGKVGVGAKSMSNLPLELQQHILNQFTRAFPFDSSAALQAVIQTVKGHLYNRDFANAFGSPEYLDAYAARWSASRALGYADLLTNLGPSSLVVDQGSTNDEASTTTVRAISIGGGAGAELAAMSAVVTPSLHLSLILLDIADWSSSIAKLQDTLTTPPPLSAYASEAAKAANKSLVEPTSLDVRFQQLDVLADWPEQLLNELLPVVDLVTIMFTLNELFSASIPRTTKMLLDLTQRMREGAQLLVVDSPGSYSEINIGEQREKTKQYPMKWLVDHTLMEVAKGKWEKVREEEGRWFRVPRELRYAVDLENMRMQVHLYKRVGAGR
jgi:25S rRNA (uracil2843-N3)-methyltransferase